jgi:Mrp family chromosome partitioning ATPase
MLGLKGERGLAAVLRDTAPIQQSVEANVYPGVIENLDVLPSGPRPNNPTELLAGDRFSEFLAWAETHYDQILIDSPPALVSDTAIIGRLTDGVLLTVQPEKNRRRVVIRATDSFFSLGINVLGVVVNRSAPEGDRGEYGYGYGYGYGDGYGFGYGYSGYGHDDGGEVDEEANEEVEQPIYPTRRDQAA